MRTRANLALAVIVRTAASVAIAGPVYLEQAGIPRIQEQAAIQLTRAYPVIPRIAVFPVTVAQERVGRVATVRTPELAGTALTPGSQVRAATLRTVELVATPRTLALVVFLVTLRIAASVAIADQEYPGRAATPRTLARVAFQHTPESPVTPHTAVSAAIAVPESAEQADTARTQERADTPRILVCPVTVAPEFLVLADIPEQDSAERAATPRTAAYQGIPPAAA